MLSDELDDKQFSLRDKLALELLKSVISSGQLIASQYSAENIYYQKENLSPEQIDNFKRIVRISYQLADVVREVRLVPFK